MPEYDPLNGDVLDEIREDYEYDVEAWRKIRREGDTDMRFLALDQWYDPESDVDEAMARRKAGRPVVVFDQLNQYVRQVVNEFMLNPRDVAVSPTGSGANDKEARLRADIIRNIHYASNAQSAHLTAAQEAVRRSYGVWGLKTEYSGEESFDLNIAVRRFADPNTVLWDADTREADSSDMMHAEVLSLMTQRKFKTLYPGRTVKDFTPDMYKNYAAWIRPKHVLLAEHWQRREIQRKLIFHESMERPGELDKVYADELADVVAVDEESGFLRVMGTEQVIPIARDQEGRLLIRSVKSYRVIQRVTNGVEVLETHEWPGSWIPLFVVVGNEMFVTGPNGSERKLQSLIRGGRDPQRALNFVSANELEAISMVPKTKWVMAEGQIEGHEDEWTYANRSPKVALLYKPTLDATGQHLLPPPQRFEPTPELGAFEMAKASLAGAIQSGLGMFNASVGRQDTNAKSGVAIRALDTQADVGTFNFRYSFDLSLQHEGRCLNELITRLCSGKREIGARNYRGEHRAIIINDPETPEDEREIITGSPYTVTIASGPSYQSGREKAEEFVDLIAKQAPELFGRIGDILVRLKNLGPIGDELVERLTPPEYQKQEGMPEMTDAARAEFNKVMGAVEELSAKLGEMTEERNAKMLELGQKTEAEKLRADVDRYKAQLNAIVGLARIQPTEAIALLQNLLTGQVIADSVQPEGGPGVPLLEPAAEGEFVNG